MSPHIKNRKINDFDFRLHCDKNKIPFGVPIIILFFILFFADLDETFAVF